MIVDESTLYWITRLDPIKDIICGCGTLTIAICILLAIVMLVLYFAYKTGDEYSDNIFKGFKIIRTFFMIAFPFALLLNLMDVFIPTTKEFMMIKVVPKIINNEKTQSLGNDAIDIAIEHMKSFKSKK